eukprot:scaffold298_cov247-Pinguiococcus_pyrenoidosus.AAC.14
MLTRLARSRRTAPLRSTPGWAAANDTTAGYPGARTAFLLEGKAVPEAAEDLRAVRRSCLDCRSRLRLVQAHPYPAILVLHYASPGCAADHGAFLNDPVPELVLDLGREGLEVPNELGGILRSSEGYGDCPQHTVQRPLMQVLPDLSRSRGEIYYALVQRPHPSSVEEAHYLFWDRPRVHHSRPRA